jgi:hypothetical protein
MPGKTRKDGARPALFLVVVLFYLFFVLYYVFLCCSMYCLFCVVLCIVCVYMCTELLPPGGYPIAVNRLNAELNPICHLLVLLGDLTFMGPCNVIIFQYTCISNKIKRYTVYLYLETTIHVSGGTSTHHQECIQLYLQHLIFVTPLLLSAAIVEELEPV